MNPLKYEELVNKWNQAWPKALQIWSPYTRLKDPVFFPTTQAAKKEGATGSFAMIRLNDHAIFINMQQIYEKDLADYALEILAHEIGHHILAPANLTDNAKVLARIRSSLPTVENMAAHVANLYEDLLINDRLKRFSELRLEQVYQKIITKESDDLWKFYMRTYEILWGMLKESLTLGKISDSIEIDAQLAAKIVRTFSKDWITGASKYAILCLPYLLKEEAKDTQSWLSALADSINAGNDGIPGGLTSIDPEELEDVIHPALDPELSDLQEDPKEKKATKKGGAIGQAREPFEYGEILRSTGLEISDHEASILYYKEQALPYLVKYPQKKSPQSKDPLPEGLETWQLGEPLEEIDWHHSVLRHGQLIPALTLDKRVYGESPGNEPETTPVDLDIYIDSSGSMPNPQQERSFLALTATIIALSALRVGAKVKATLWSGKNQFYTTPGFSSNEKEILSIITEFFGGATQFPTHILRDTYFNRNESDRSVHILIISDDGVSTIVDQDEKGNSGSQVAATALKNARGGGSMVLNAPKQNLNNIFPKDRWQEIGEWNFYFIREWADLIDFARRFSNQKYEQN